eukprot:2193558-Alexandrium_andersonii.AAC.1
MSRVRRCRARVHARTLLGNPPTAHCLAYRLARRLPPPKNPRCSAGGGCRRPCQDPPNWCRKLDRDY